MVNFKTNTDNSIKMTDADWAQLKFMTKKDNWGDPSKMSKLLVFTLENMRIFAGKPLLLTCPAYANSGHAEAGEHPKGNAADYRFEGMDILGMYLLAERFGFTGIGCYPNNGVPFMHVDVRTSDESNVFSRWIAIGNPAAWTYVEFNESNFRKYCL